MKKEHFVVDAVLLKELGERLIGRPAIALGELVKNSFDADASTCQIAFSKDEIVISDNGTGMSKADFLNYWMRIGTTHKVDQGTSKVLGRPLTGSKGIGRLSAQFLADEMTLESTSDDTLSTSLYAIVDWRNAVPGQNLTKVNVEWEMRPDVLTYPLNSQSGTRITLRTLKNEWDAAAIRNLGDEVWMLRSPFKRPAKDAVAVRPEDFIIDIKAPEIAGAWEAFDQRLQAVFSNWKARIRGKLDHGRSGDLAVVSVEFRPGYPEGSEGYRIFRENVPLPIERKDGSRKPLLDNVTFEILIFKLEGRQPAGIKVAEFRDYLTKFGNVSVYDTGFRLPYYGSKGGSKGGQAGEDWLSIAADQGRRISVSELLPEHLQTQKKYMQDLPAPGRIFGAVEISTNRERHAVPKPSDSSQSWLEIQPGRDRLHDNQAFYQLRDLVRYSLDFYANRFRVLDLETVEKNRAKEPPAKKYDRAIEILERSRDDMPEYVFREVKRAVAEARKASEVEEKTIDRRAALLAPLASAGMAALALNHEVSREERFLDRVGSRLRRIAVNHSIRELREIADEFDQAKRRLGSLRELFAPLLSDMDKSATDRLKVCAVVDQSIGAMRALMPGVKFDAAGIPADLRFPLGSLAEWNALLQNILSNAWNALLDSEKAEISFRGGRDGRGGEWLHMSDTGQGLDVPLSEAGKLFEPFERRIKISDDKRSIAIGGQGLGLAIVRMIARRRSANVAFVKPEQGFTTTFEIAWRGAKT